MKIEKVVVSALAYGGAGVCRLADGRVAFVPGTLPGEEVEIRIIAEKKRFVLAELAAVITPSDQRREAPCPLGGKCPGCVYMHCTYDLEIRWKDRQFRDFLLRSSLADEAVFAPPFAAPQELFYRNKLVLHRDKQGNYGYFGMDNRTILPVEKCFLADEKINDLLPQACGREALFRSSADGAILIDPRNPGTVREVIPGAGEFIAAGDGFFQTNPAVAQELVAEVVSAVVDGRRHNILELYCGVGIFSVALAKKDEKIRCTGVEVNSDAIGFARKNARLNQVEKQCRFFAGDAGKTAGKFASSPDSIVIDPPRSGVEAAALDKVISLHAPQIVYISCAADTLSRDLKKLTASGYRITRARVLDMFPRTAHFESLTVLERDN
jgi:tRNA/tmRNA/rRNA uracil-C5-methylase (TrmA/RlmC/RlmD family)